MSEHATTHAATHTAEHTCAQPVTDIDAQRALMEATIARCERLHVVPHLQGLSFDTLIAHAIAYRNGMLFNDAATHGYNISYIHLHELDRADCERHVVNMLRHAGTEYDAALASIDTDAPGGDIAAAYIREYTYAAIATAYPNLTAECGRQMLARGLAPGQALATLRVREMHAGVAEAVTLAPAQASTTKPEPKPTAAPAKQAQQPVQQPTQQQPAAAQQTQTQPQQAKQKQPAQKQQPAKKTTKAQQQPKQQQPKQQPKRK